MSDTETKPDVRDGIIHTAIPADEVARLSDDIIAALKTVYDPEIPSDIFELGLIYKIDIEDDRTVKIVMTLTAPGCPVAGDEAPLAIESHRGQVVASRQGLHGSGRAQLPVFGAAVGLVAEHHGLCLGDVHAAMRAGQHVLRQRALVVGREVVLGDRMLFDRHEVQPVAARRVVAPGAPGGEEIQPEAEAGFENDEAVALLPA